MGQTKDLTKQKHKFIVDALRKEPATTHRIMKRALETKFGSGIDSHGFYIIRREVIGNEAADRLKADHFGRKGRKVKTASVTVLSDRAAPPEDLDSCIQEIFADTAKKLKDFSRVSRLSFVYNSEGKYEVEYEVTKTFKASFYRALNDGN